MSEHPDAAGVPQGDDGADDDAPADVDATDFEVLLVEDHPGDATLIRHHFEGDSFAADERHVDLTHVDCLTDALEELDAANYDCVFLDLGLPESSGLDTLERVVDANPRAPVVVLTGLDDRSRALEAIKVGAQDYLVKDAIDSRTLSRALRYAVERARKERELRTKTEQIEFFNSLLRHDVGNDLQLIQAQATQLAETLDDPEDAALAADVVERSDAVVDLIETVRSVLQTVTGEGSSSLRVVDLRDVLHSQADLVRAMDDGVTVEVDGPEEAFVLADDLLSDVLGNVMANAVEHGHDDPTIEVTVTDAGDRVRVAVADDGPGIDDPERVLKRGEKGASSTGTGFGLYFVATMVEAYGGHVTIRDDDGPGAVVELELPAA